MIDSELCATGFWAWFVAFFFLYGLIAATSDAISYFFGV